MTAKLRGLLVLCYGALGMVFFFLVSLPVMLLPKGARLPMWFARRIWAPWGLRLAGVRLEVARLAPLPDGPAVFACNHESALDIWAAVAAVPRSVRFIAKKELFDIPVFGWYLALGGHVKVDRRDHAQAVASLSRAARRVRAGTSLIVFPEGTRSRDGRVHPFKKGPFVIAVEAGVPVVPVAVVGSGSVVAKRRLEVRPGSIRVSLGPAVHPRDVPDRTALLCEVRRRVIEQHRALGGLGGPLDEQVAAPGMEGAA